MATHLRRRSPHGLRNTRSALPQAGAKAARDESPRIGVVYHNAAHFAGFPANAGQWNWGKEILTAFYVGAYRKADTVHAIDLGQPMRIGLARSVDGGKHWSVTLDNEINRIVTDPIIPLPQEGIQFAHPRFALKIGQSGITIHGDRFMVSYDAGHSWQGPYALPGPREDLTARTDYLVESENSCLLFLSARHLVPGYTAYSDRAYVVRSDDYGHTWTQLGFLTDAHARSVMPSSVRMSDGRLISAFSRRKYLHETGLPGEPGYDTENWIEVRGSSDGGLTWQHLSRLMTTWALAYSYGNAPALVRLPDGRLVIVYGYRGKPPRLVAHISEDGGYSWSEEIVLDGDVSSSDMGYPRIAVLPFGKLVITYYTASSELPEQHIKSVLWTP